MTLLEPQFLHLLSKGHRCLSSSSVLFRPAFHFLDLLSLLPQGECAKPAHDVLWGSVQCDLLRGSLDTQWYLWNKLTIYNLANYWPHGRSLFLPCSLGLSTRWKALAAFPGLCKISISEHRGKFISRAGFGQRRNGQPRYSTRRILFIHSANLFWVPFMWMLLCASFCHLPLIHSLPGLPLPGIPSMPPFFLNL